MRVLGSKLSRRLSAQEIELEAADGDVSWLVKHLGQGAAIKQAMLDVTERADELSEAELKAAKRRARKLPQLNTPELQQRLFPELSQKHVIDVPEAAVAAQQRLVQQQDLDKAEKRVQVARQARRRNVRAAERAVLKSTDAVLKVRARTGSCTAHRAQQELACSCDCLPCQCSQRWCRKTPCGSAGSRASLVVQPEATTWPRADFSIHHKQTAHRITTLRAAQEYMQRQLQLTTDYETRFVEEAEARLRALQALPHAGRTRGQKAARHNAKARFNGQLQDARQDLLDKAEVDVERERAARRQPGKGTTKPMNRGARVTGARVKRHLESSDMAQETRLQKAHWRWETDPTLYWEAPTRRPAAQAPAPEAAPPSS